MVKICNQKPLNFFRDYWLGLILFVLYVIFMPSIEQYIIHFFGGIADPKYYWVYVAAEIIVYLLGIWITWMKFIGKRPSISFN